MDDTQCENEFCDIEEALTSLVERVDALEERCDTREDDLDEIEGRINGSIKILTVAVFLVALGLSIGMTGLMS